MGTMLYFCVRWDAEAFPEALAGGDIRKAALVICAEGFPPRGRNSSAIAHWQQSVSKMQPNRNSTFLWHLPLQDAAATWPNSHVCARPTSFALQAEGGKGNLACQAGRSSQLLAVPLRRASITCLPGTIATASHNLQTARKPEYSCLCPVAMGWELLCGWRACGCTRPRGRASACGLGCWAPPRAHTARGCPHPGDGACAGKPTQILRKPTTLR